jgi:hypothetical protein
MAKKFKKVANKNKKSSNNANNLVVFEQLKNEIFGDVKKINNFNILIQHYIKSLEDNEKTDIKNLRNIIKEIFEYFLITNKQKISLDLLNYLEEKLETLNRIYLDLSDIDDPDQSLKMFKKIENNLNLSKNKEKIKLILNAMIDKFILTDEIVDPNNLSNITNTFLTQDDIFLEILTILNNYFTINTTYLNANVIYNTYNFLISIPKVDQNNFNKTIYQYIIIQIINNKNTPRDIIKNILTNLNKVILDNLDNPLIFSDYLINLYEHSEAKDYDIKVLSLSGLFILITKYKLDYSNYYNILYKTLGMFYNSDYGLKYVIDSKYKARFFKILELSLKSTTVPIIVVFSFIKVKYHIFILILI